MTLPRMTAARTLQRAVLVPRAAAAPVRRGTPLPPEIRRLAEQLFGVELSDVRVHLSARPRQMRALAFTSGADIYVSPERYDPGSEAGLRLLGHEIAHVVQQRCGRARNPHGYGVAVLRDAALEAEAERMGEALVAGARRAARGPDPVAVMQAKRGPASRSPEPASREAARPLTAPRRSTVAQKSSEEEADPEFGIVVGHNPILYDLCPAKSPNEGGHRLVPVGSYCEWAGKQEGDWIEVFVWSGVSKNGWIRRDQYLPQIDLVDKDKNRLHWVELWNPDLFEVAPGLTDVRQGDLNDCFLLASLAAMAGTPLGVGTLTQMITCVPDTRTYSVRFYEKDDEDEFTIPRDVVVDAWLPVTAGGDFAYCLRGYRALPDSQGLWSAIIEKAFAKFLGNDGYAGLDDEGDPDDAMGQLTGTGFETITDMNDDSDEALLGYIRDFGDRPKVADTEDALPKRLRNKLIADHVYVLVRLVGEQLLLWDVWAYKSVQITLDELRAGFTSIGSPYDPQ
jgi:hypothetical protein